MNARRDAGRAFTLLRQKAPWFATRSIFRRQSGYRKQDGIFGFGGFRKDSVGGFTLIEVLVAVSLLAAAMAITFSTYFSVSKAWQRGVILADNLNHGDYVMEQLVNGLRCSFFPPPQTGTTVRSTDYGFFLEKSGSGTEARDSISWVKTGAALLGPDNALYRGLHRVRLSIEEDPDGLAAVAVRAWRPYANPDSFDPALVDPFYVSGKVQGLSCRVATNRTDDGWEWQDNWEDEATNHLPLAVEIILYLDPTDRGDPPLEMKRMVEIPLAPLSWSKK
ncbi:MAG: prepilin-type N-terminal cleavage/methylation domain-containing protein [Verrucomicrobia bacterium]|nr:prepilin-type N-terminal cleavage/methylation domain-containing protein [Verrucomicrobiota bacterium]MBU4292267.1 prepilin-type N-terminal cleavage/methylation domain-containing protein [Verrucomicrobiota bacterium]MBU4428287.1 prepilin-type N-terminal cleavage/methylation domain-containing protein [Verrucomicrobiota bacterium]MBU4497835.1 prepilin-type N-terminal cleavage/methylation domain-containing protein [Verrucomicrobiota bacterium]